MKTARLLGPALLFGLAALSFARWAKVCAAQLAVPFDLVFEGPLLATVKALQKGLPIYDASVYGDGPLVFTMYPPLFHGLAALFPAGGADPFLAGRLIGLSAMFLAGASLWWADRRRALWTAAAAAAFFCLAPVMTNAALFKNDGLGVLFSAAAVILAAKRPSDARALAAASALCVLAFLCKQSFVSAPLACSLFIGAKDARKGALFAACTAGAAVLSCAAISWVWGSGFWYCVFGSLAVPFSRALFLGHWLEALRQPVFVGLWASFAAGTVMAFRQEKARVFTASPYFLYAAFSVLTLAGLAKAGADTNYFIEPCLAGLLWILSSAGMFLKEKGWVVLIPLLAGWTVETAGFLGKEPPTFAGQRALASFEAGLRDLNAELGKFPGGRPEVLNLCNGRWAEGLSAEVRVNDPFLYYLLWSRGRLDAAPLVRSVRDGFFDAVLLAPGWGPGHAEGPAKAVWDAVFDRYELRKEGPWFQVFVRKKT